MLNIVHGTGAGAGAPLTGHPGVDRVAFTGSPLTARTVYRDAAAQLTPVSFELGGKSPFLVFADCDLDAAAATAAYQYDNSGQVCLAGTRLLVERARARAVPRAPARARRGDRRRRSARAGDDLRSADPPGRARARHARASRARVEQGARLVFGGEGLGGLYYPPTLFADVPADAEILQTEVFGPVLTIQPFADEAEAIALANAHRLRARRDRLHRVAVERSERVERGARGRYRVGQLLLRSRPRDARSAARANRASAARAAVTRSTSTAMSRPSASERAASTLSARGLILSHGEQGPAGLLGEWLTEHGVRYEVHDVSRGAGAGARRLRLRRLARRRCSRRTTPSRAWVARGDRAAARGGRAPTCRCSGCASAARRCRSRSAARSRPRRKPQIGWFELSERAERDPARARGFTGTTSSSACRPAREPLAHSEVGPAAFRHGPHLGLQFHPEVTVEVIASWSRSEAELEKLGVSPEELRRRERSARRSRARARLGAVRAVVGGAARRDRQPALARRARDPRRRARARPRRSSARRPRWCGG